MSNISRILHKLNNKQLIEAQNKHQRDELDDYDPLIDHRQKKKVHHSNFKYDISDSDCNNEDDLLSDHIESTFHHAHILNNIQIPNTMNSEIRLGQSRFEIDNIHKLNKKRGNLIQRDDGKTLLNSTDIQRAKEKLEWYKEEDLRQRIVERSRDYQFMILVAGASNTKVYQLYDQDNLERAERRERGFIQQQIDQISKSTVSVSELTNQKRELEKFLTESNSSYNNYRLKYDEWNLVYSEYSPDADRFIDTLNKRCFLERRKKYVDDTNTSAFVANNDLLQWLAEETNKREAVVPDKLLKALFAITESSNNNNNEEETPNDEDYAEVFFIPEDSNVKELQNGPSLTKEQEEDLKQKKGTPFYPSLIVRLITEYLFDYWIKKESPLDYQEMIKIQDNIYRNDYRTSAMKRIVNKPSDLDSLEFKTLERRFYATVIQILGRLLSEKLITLTLDFNNPLLNENSKIQALLNLEIEDPFRRTLLATEIMSGQSPTTIEAVAEAYKIMGGVDCLSLHRQTFSRFFTSQFNDALLKLQTQGIQTGTQKEPIMDAVRLYVKYLKSEMDAAFKGSKKYQNAIGSIQQRIEDMSNNIVHIQEIEYPYEHKTSWISLPEHSGTVQLLPIVVQAINDAYDMITQYTPLKGVSVEVLQHNEVVRSDFAKLVAIKMAFSAQRFPKQYYLEKQRHWTRQEEFDIMQRLKKKYQIYWKRTESGETVLDVMANDQKNSEAAVDRRVFKKRFYY